MCLKVFKDFCSQRAEKRRVKLTRINKNSCGENKKKSKKVCALTEIFVTLPQKFIICYD